MPLLHEVSVSKYTGLYITLTSVFDVEGENLVMGTYRSVLTPDDIDRVLLERHKLGIPKFERFLETIAIHCVIMSGT